MSFLSAVILRWQALATGGAVTAIIGAGERLMGRAISKRMYFVVFIIGYLLVGFFMAWKDQFEAGISATAKLKSAPAKVEMVMPPLLEKYLEGQLSGKVESANPAIADPARPPLKGKELQKPAPVNTPPAPAILPAPLPVESLQFAAQEIPSTNRDVPYALSVVVQANVDIEPVSIMLVCKVSCELNPRFSGMNFRIGHATGHDNWAIFACDIPKLTPSKPLIFEVDSKEPNEILAVRRFSF